MLTHKANAQHLTAACFFLETPTRVKLIAAPKDQPTLIIYAEKEDFFFEKTEDIRVEFTRNDKKEVDRFILHQEERM